jgi:divalent metal cation (Fe/Co/Zn/Cd) transporter
VSDAVERAVQSALPEADVVVHVEPLGDRAEVRERAHAAALGVRRVREVHNVSVVSTNAGTEISMHLKLPGGLSLDEAHEIAEDVERAIVVALPEVSSVQTHLEPLAEEAEGTRVRAEEVATEHNRIARIVRDAIGCEATELRFLHTDDGLVVHLTLPLPAGTTLADAHAEASRIEEMIRSERPEIADVLVHTEPQ